MRQLRQDIRRLLEQEKKFITKRELCALLGIKGAKRRDLKQVLAELKSEGLYAVGVKDAPDQDKPYPKKDQDAKAAERSPGSKVRKAREIEGEARQSGAEKLFRPAGQDTLRDPKRAVRGESRDLKPGANRSASATLADKRPQKRAVPHKIFMGIFNQVADNAWIEPAHRKESFAPIRLTDVALSYTMVQFELVTQKSVTLSHNDVISFKLDSLGRVVLLERVGNLSEPKVFSLMAIHAADVPFDFSKEAVALAMSAAVPPVGNRTDYRDIPLVTIDGEDARDFDDAVYATADLDPENEGGWFAIVAIADVSYYVRPGDALDAEAYARGNSIYFADRVVPMLPEALSNEMCSLKPNEDRACIAVEMHISSVGDLLNYQFKRGLMRSAARLTYTEVQSAIDTYGEPSVPAKRAAVKPTDGAFNAEADGVRSSVFWDNILCPLYGVYKSLRKARNRRGSLDLESTERKVIFTEEGKIKAIVPRVQTVSNQLIEELMIAANVAAAKALSSQKWPSLYRVHDKPDETRVLNMRRIATSLGLAVSKEKNMSAKSFNVLLNIQSPFKRMIHDLVLRSQCQAIYSPNNLGHYGLGLSHYAHFTSPIRRYADLCVHRGLISLFNLGEGGQEAISLAELGQIGEHISATERVAAHLERDVMDRYLVLHLEDYVGHSFEAVIVGVNAAGIFFELEGSGAQGFLHKSRLLDDYYILDEENHRYVGKRTHRTFQLGGAIRVILDAADASSCTTVFSLPEPAKRSARELGQHMGRREGHHEGKKRGSWGNRRESQNDGNSDRPYSKRPHEARQGEARQGEARPYERGEGETRRSDGTGYGKSDGAGHGKRTGKGAPAGASPYKKSGRKNPSKSTATNSASKGRAGLSKSRTLTVKDKSKGIESKQ